MNPNAELVAQNKQFEKQVIELGSGVYGAIGFAASNVYMLIGDDGLVIIDSTETTKAAQNILAEFRKLTDKQLASKPYLKEFYGKVAWSVRAYFAGTLGWFDGNPTNLAKLSPKQSADRTIKLAGGADALLKTAQQAAEEDDHQWVLELSDHLIHANEHAHAAKALKIASLRAMAGLEINAAGRNYYLLSAQEMEQSVE